MDAPAKNIGQSSVAEQQGDPVPTELNREMFKETLELLALRIPQRMTSPMLSKLGGSFLLSRPRVKVVVPDPAGPKAGETRLLLLKETVTDLKQLPTELRDFVTQNAEVTNYTLQLGYPHLSTDQVFKRLLPANVPMVSSFETIGHIAHLNLKDEHMPYKHLIGQVILDKNPRLRTVVNKTHSISTTFRTFNMEVLAGSQDLSTEVSESKCRFRFNYGEVYWNSRLQHEHDRMIKKLKPHDIVCDMFAGVGPFAVPAAKNVGCRIYANDLNPKSYKALIDNVALNKVKNLVKCHNMDARDFVRHLLAQSPPIEFSQVFMNLPASAEQFLDVFRGFPSALRSPTIHCYVFTKEHTNPNADVIKRVEEVLGCGLEREATEIHEVRDVSPKKLMMCVSFPLPRAAVDASHLPATPIAAAAEERGVKRKDRQQSTNDHERKEDHEAEQEEQEEQEEPDDAHLKDASSAKKKTRI